MKIFIIILVTVMCGLGIVGAVGYFTNGFRSVDTSSIKQQLNSLKNTVEELQERVNDAIHRENNQPTNECQHNSIDGNGYCTQCGQYVGVSHDCNSQGHVDNDMDGHCDYCGAGVQSFSGSGESMIEEDGEF